MPWIVRILLTSLPFVAASAQAAAADLLPPLPPWQPRNLSLIAAPDDPWITPAERDGLTTTPRYAETMEYLRRLAGASPSLTLVSIGRSGEQRDIWMVIASRDGAGTPAALAANGRPTVLAQAGIHAGEIDGKDAGLMLLRDMTVAGTRAELLEKANFLFVPILNVDGHERFGPHGRMNQRGPKQMGWRTNGRNLNLNRDYAKLRTPGVAAMVEVIQAWQPDLYLDLHVTDGVDYQYDITFGFNGEHAWSPDIARWMNQRLEPALTRALSGAGHIPGPLIFARNHRDYSAGIYDWTASPRYSNGYGDARHLATVLVENHSLKPYMQRVLGTYELLAASLKAVADYGEELAGATAADRARRRDEVVLNWVTDTGSLPERMLFRGVGSEPEYSPVSGDVVVRWNGLPTELGVAVLPNNRPGDVVSRPARYYIPAAWHEVAATVAAHGIRVTQVGAKHAGSQVEVERYRLPGAKAAGDPNPFEGRMRIDPGVPVVQRATLTLSAGDFVVATDQPLGTLAILLLEPLSPDSLLQWGYFLEIMNRTEYFEQYAAEPLAAAMLAADPELASAFRQRLRDDEDFAADAEARLRWFYERSPYHDQRYLVYPVSRSLN